MGKPLCMGHIPLQLAKGEELIFLNWGGGVSVSALDVMFLWTFPLSLEIFRMESDLRLRMTSL